MKLRTAIIGFGQISQSYTLDSRMKMHFQYATHAQVLRDHPAFDCQAVVDPAPEALQSAQSDWNIKETATHLAKLPSLDKIEVAVIATKPGYRAEIIELMPALKGVIVEKPLGSTLKEALIFLETCRKRRILVQVNLLRRADDTMRQLASGKLYSMVGDAQALSIHYGNGLLNNGTHMIDLARMLFGDILSVTAFPKTAFEEGPLPQDKNFALTLQWAHGLTASLQPLKFRNYRENSFDIWGEHGRLAITQEGLTMLEYRIADNRSADQRTSPC